MLNFNLIMLFYIENIKRKKAKKKKMGKRLKIFFIEIRALKEKKKKLCR